MKNHFLTLAFIFVTIKSVSQENLLVTYQFKNSKYLTYNTTLKIAKNLSYFENKHKKEKIKVEYADLELAKKDIECYYDSNSKTFLFNNSLEDNTKVYSKDVVNYEWEITNETKKMLGYTVTKAYRKITDDDIIEKGRVVVWFTTELPYFTGPYDYVGLPGLILEAGYEKSKYLNYYKAISIETINNATINMKTNNGIKISLYYNRNPAYITKKYLKKQKDTK